MKKGFILRSALTAMMLISVLYFNGCSDNSTPTNGSGNVSQAPVITSSYPQNNQTGVTRSTAMTIVFDMPMDSLSVDHNFYFAGGPDMAEWMDSLQGGMGMGGMGGGHMMDMTHMMNWLDSIQTHGTFHWNAASDSCVFVPDSSLMPNSDYMIFLHGSLRGQNGMMMDMSAMQYNGYMVNFRTAP